jgi:hypothetical protein
MAFRIQLRRDTAIKWAVNNPVLLQAEMGYETDTTLLKIGDGTTNWNDLGYWNGNLSIEVGGTNVVQGAGTLNFIGGVSATLATGGIVTLDFAGIGGLTGPTGPEANIDVSGPAGGVTGATGIRFTGGVSVTANGKEAVVSISTITSNLYNNTVRYLIDSNVVGRPTEIAGNESVQILSSGNLYTGKSWIRSGTTLTIYSDAHGLVQGNGVLVRNSATADSYGYFLVDSVVSANSFSIVVPDSGDLTGDGLTYIPAFSVTTYDPGVSMIVEPPANGNAQLTSITVTTRLDANSAFDVQISGGIVSNGAGANTSLYTMNIPSVGAVDAESGSNLAGQITSIPSGLTDTFSVIGLNNANRFTIIKLSF